MERLIATAAQLDSSVKSNDMSFGNMVKAIGVIQDQMGITGTTALEAATTISGSVASMKAAWQNLLVGVADDNAQFDVLIANFVDSAGTAAANVLPRVTTALNGAARLITSLLPTVIGVLPEMVTTVLPQMAEAAVGIIQALIDGISQNQDTLMQTAMDIILILTNGIISLLPQLVDLGLQLIVTLANSLSQAAPTLIPAITECVLLIASTLIEYAPELIIAGLELGSQILVGLVDSMPLMVQWAIDLPQKISDILQEDGETMVSAGENFVNNIMQGFVVAWNSFSLVVKELINGLLAEVHNAIVSLGGEQLLATLGFDGPLQISTDFEHGKIAQAKHSMGMYDQYYITQNINSVPQSPAQLAAATVGEFNTARWSMN